MSAVAPPLGRVLGNCDGLCALGIGGTRLGEIVLPSHRSQVRRLISAGLDAVADTAARKFQGNRLSQSLEHWAGTDSHTAAPVVHGSANRRPTLTLQFPYPA